MPKVPLLRRVLPWLGYAAFFVLCFLVFAYWAFPYDRLRSFAEQQFKVSQGPAKRFALGIGELGPSGFLGLAAQDVTYTKLATVKGATPGSLTVDELSVQPSLFGLLMGRRGGSFEAQAGGGTATGEVSQSEEELEVEAELEDLDVAQLGLGEYLGVPMTGRATGTVDLHLPKDATQSQGKIDLVVRGVTLGDGEAKIAIPGMRDGFTLERLNAGKLEVRVAIKDGTATVEKFAADGKDINLDLSGTARLANPVRRSRLKLTFMAKFSDAYKERDAKTKAVFELMGFRPELKRATTPDGALRFLINGTVGVPQARPAGRIPKRPQGK